MIFPINDMILPTKECLFGMMYYLGVWKHLFLYDKNTEVQCNTEKYWKVTG